MRSLLPRRPRLRRSAPPIGEFLSLTGPAALPPAGSASFVAFRADPQDPHYRESLCRHYAALARLQRETGRLAEAAATSLERRQVAAGDPRELFWVGRDLACTAGLVGRGEANL